MNEEGFNKYQLSLAVQCTPQTVINWFDYTSFPDYEALFKLSDYFKVPIDYFFGLTACRTFDKAITQSLFATRFKECMTRHPDLTEYQVAKECGIMQSTISKWTLHGRMPRTETIIKLAKLFDCSIEYLLGRTEMRNFKS